jgi:hypothetical protein
MAMSCMTVPGCTWWFDGAEWVKLFDGCPAPCYCQDITNDPAPAFINFKVLFCSDPRFKGKPKVALEARVLEKPKVYKLKKSKSPKVMKKTKPKTAKKKK